MKMCSGSDLAEGNRFLHSNNSIACIKKKKKCFYHIVHCSIGTLMAEDILSKNIPMMPGKAIIIVTLVCTEVAQMHRLELVTLLLLCTLILQRYFIEYP